MPIDKSSTLVESSSLRQIPKRDLMKENQKSRTIKSDFDLQFQKIENSHARIMKNADTGILSKQKPPLSSKSRGTLKKHASMLAKKKFIPLVGTNRMKVSIIDPQNANLSRGLQLMNMEKMKLDKDLVERKRIINDLKIEHDLIARDKTILLMEMKNMRKYLDEVKSKLDRSMMVLSKPCKLPKLCLNSIAEKKLASSSILTKARSLPKKRSIKLKPSALKVPIINKKIEEKPVDTTSYRHSELKTVFENRVIPQKIPFTQYYVNPNTVKNLFESVNENEIPLQK